jgi:tetratricopeptide (TPR) repeat protein
MNQTEYGQAGCAEPRQKAKLRRLQRKAEHLAQEGRVNEALNCQQEVIALTPNDPDAYMRLGFLHRSVYQIDEAVHAFRRASGLNPLFPDPHEALAEAYLDAAHYDEAIKESKALLRLVPNSLPARDILSAAYMQKGQIEKALRVTSEMVRLSPLDAMSHYKRGLLHRQRSAWREALEEFSIAAEIAPVGSIERGEAEAAIEALDRHQISEILLLASEDRLFQMRLSRNVQEAIQERGYHVSSEAQSFLQRAATDEIMTVAMMEPGSFYGHGPRLRLYN